ELVERRELLRGLALRQLVRRREPRAEREPRVHAVDAGDVRVARERDRAVAGDERCESCKRSALDVHGCGGEDRVEDVRHPRNGDLLVEGAPLVVQPTELRLVPSERAIAATDALPARVDVLVDPDRDCALGEAPADGLARHRTAAERHDQRLGRSHQGVDGLHLPVAERRLALREELGDRASGVVLDEAVGVDERPAEPEGGRLAERRLARAHEADEREVLVYRGRQSIRSTYARQAATKSPSASPPNFSRAARASSHATAASATTARASTAETSLRSTSAVAGSPVSRSTDASGCISVGNGFIEHRTTTSSPFDMPPSSPPARFVSRYSPRSSSR